MEDTTDFHSISGDTINRQEGQAGNHQLARALETTRPANLRKCGQRVEALQDRFGDTSRGLGPILLDVAYNVFQIGRRIGG